MVSIENQVAVVTGAGRGIGRAIAIELGKMGARVAVAARSRNELDETAREIGVCDYSERFQNNRRSTRFSTLSDTRFKKWSRKTPQRSPTSRTSG